MKSLVTLCVSLALASSSVALTLQVDYGYDALALGGTGFFAGNALARAAVDQAAADLSAAITSSFAAITKDTFTGTEGRTDVTFNWGLQFSNPSQAGEQIKLETFSLPADTIRLYVGMRPLLGSTLGQGGPGGVTLSWSAKTSASSQAAFDTQLSGAVAVADSLSDETMLRGEGPVMGSISGSFNTAGTSFQASYGALIGTLWFDNDTNNDGAVDSSTTLANFWHYDPSKGVVSGKNDLYSVALHEMLHALGIGTAETWTNLVSGTTWLGSEAQLLNRGPSSSLLSGDGDHVQSGLLSRRLSDGTLQEVVMDPTLTVGTRKYLTEMDMGFLRDIGYTTVPEPSTALLTACGAGLFALRRRQRS